MDKQNEDFKNNKVFIWGQQKASNSLLNHYDKGNKNPNSLKMKKEPVNKAKKQDKEIKRVFDVKEKYTKDDLDFLKSEYERLEKESETDYNNDTLADKMDKLDEIITNLEYMQPKEEKIEQNNNKDKWKNIDKINDELSKARDEYIQSRGNPEKRAIMNALEDKLKIAYGSGLKGGKIEKGSEEAKAVGRRLMEARQTKKVAPKPKEEKVVKQTMTRVKKGSEEAKTLGQRLAEARKKKKELKDLEKEEEIKIDKDKPLNPWFYIGDIPKGYREATEDEAIEKEKVSRYGKYEVDEIKYKFFEEFHILLSENISNALLNTALISLKKKALRMLQEIEIISNKIENPKYEDKRNSNIYKKIDEEENFKFLKKGYNWLYRLYCKRHNKEYIKPEFKLPEIEEIKYQKSDYIYKPKEEEKDIRKVNKSYKLPKIIFSNYEYTVDLPQKYFDRGKLLSKYAQKLYDKHIILAPEYYGNDDKDKYFYHKKDINGGSLVNRKPDNEDLKYKDIVQSVLFSKNNWPVKDAKKWLKNNGFYYDSIDETKNEFRFRQFNPDDLPKRHYISEKISDGILLIISVRTPLKIEHY